MELKELVMGLTRNLVKKTGLFRRKDQGQLISLLFICTTLSP